MANNNFDVIIVGAGPAGLACALELADSDFSVLIIDKNKILGTKPCGGGICEKEVAVEYDPSFVKIISKQVIQQGNSKVSLTHKYKRITFEREDLAKFQESKIIGKKNITIMKETMVEKITPEKVITSKGEFSYKYLVGADGATSNVRRYLGLPFKYCFGMLYKIWGDYDEFVGYYDIAKIKLGYIWEFPHPTYNNIGIYYDPNNLKAVDAKAELQAYLKRRNYKFDEKDFVAAPVNYSYKGHKFGNIFLIGDAGGFTSRMHGGGMNNGIISGKEVAKMIKDPEYFPKEIAQLIKDKVNEDKMLDFALKLPTWLLKIIGNFLVNLYKIPYFQKVMPF
jgi:geranylgeranyl reductase